MTVPPTAHPRPATRRRRWWRRLRVALLLLLLLLALLLLFARPLLTPVVDAVLTGQLESRLGGDWRLERIESLGLTGITLGGLEQLEPAADGAVRSCRIDTLAIGWKPFRLLSSPLGALSELRCTGIDLELAADQPLLVAAEDEAPEEDGSEPDAGADLLQQLDPGLRIDLVGTATITYGERTCRIDHLALHGTPRDLVLSVAPWHLDDQRLQPVQAQWHSDDLAAGGRLIASAPVLGEITGTAERSGTEDPWQASLDGRSQEGDWSVQLAPDGWQVQVEDLDLSRFFSLLSADGQPLPAALTRYSRLWVEAEGDGERIRSELRFTAGTPQPRPPITARLEGAWSDGRLRLDLASVDADPGRIEIRDLSWSPEEGVTALEHASASGWRLPAVDPLRPPVLALELRRDQDLLHLTATVEDGGMELDLALRAQPHIATSRWQTATLAGRWRLDWPLPHPQRGELASLGRISGTALEPEAELMLSGEDLQWADLPPTSLQIEAAVRPGRAMLTRCRIKAEDWQLDLEEPAVATWSDGAWQLQPLQLGRHHLQARGTTAGITSARLHLAPIPLASLALLSPGLSGITGSLAGDLEIDHEGQQLETSWSLLGVGASEQEEALWNAGLAITTTEAGIRGTLQIDEDGGPRRLSIQGQVDHPFAARWDWPQELADAPLQLSAKLHRLGMERLAELVPALLYARGEIDGEATITGTLSEPEPRGQLRFQEVDFTTAGLPPVTALTGQIDLEAQAATTSGLHCRLGYAPLRIAGSWALATDGEHDLAITGERVLLIERQDLRVRADLDCRLHGPVSAPEFGGRIGVTEFLYSAEMGWLGFGGGATGAKDPVLQLFSIDVEPWSRMRFDLSISDGSLGEGAGSGLSIRTPLFAGDMLLDLDLGGTGALPEPVGTIASSGARLRLPFTTYTVESATIRFLEENPFEPVIVATLRTRMAGYEVRLQVEGPLSDPRLDVTTSPPLPSDDALLLATTGLTPTETADGTAAAIGTAIPFLGRELKRLLLGPGDPDAEPGLLSRVQFSVDEERSEGGLSTARIEFEMTPRWYLYAERDRFEDYNGGLLWRYSFGQSLPSEPVDQDEPEPKPSAIVWRIEQAEGVRDLPLAKRTLRREIRRQRSAFDRSGGDILHAADAAAIMARSLQQEGYPHAQVRLAFEPTRENPEVIIFEADPGRRWAWGEVLLEGVPVEHREPVEQIARSHTVPGSDYVAKDLDQALREIQLHLQLDGYANAQARASEPQFLDETGRVVTAIMVDAGMRHTFAAPRLSGGERLPDEVGMELRSMLEDLSGRPWMRRTAVIARSSIQNLLKQHGYQWAQVELAVPEGKLPSAVPVTFHLDPGPVVRLAEVELSGFETTAESYVRQRLALEPGEPLEQDDLERGLSRLRQTVPLRRLNVELQPVGADGSERAVLALKAEEAPSHHVELHAGYGSYVGLLGGARYRDENLFGRGRQWIVGGEASQKHYLGTTSLSDRDLLGGNRLLTLTGEYSHREEPSFTDTRASIEPAVLFPLTEQQQLRLAYLLEFTEAEDVEGGIAGAEIDGFIRTARFDAGWRFDTRDDRWLPSRGWMLELGAGIADESIGSELDFLELRAGSGVVLPLWGEPGDASLALRVHATTRKPTAGRETLPIQERLFLGGANSVRSFDTELLSPTTDDGDAQGGLTAAFAQAEARFRLVGRLHAALFYDIGAVDPEPWVLNQEFGHAIGAGLRLHLPVGPLRFDVAYNPGETFAEDDRWAMHLAVGFTF